MSEANMKEWTVTYSAFVVTSHEITVIASTPALAREVGEEVARDAHPDADEIRIDGVLFIRLVPLTSAPDSLDKARDIITRLLGPAEHGALDLGQTDEPAGRLAEAAIEEARAFLATERESPACPE